MNEQNNGTQGQKHPLALSPAILILNIILAVLGAIIGMERSYVSVSARIRLS